jgi:hypothetical protein
VFPLSLQGLQPVQAAGGAVDLVAPGGKVVAFIPAGSAYDSKVDPSSGERGTTDAVGYQLTTYQGVPALRVTLDQAWLSDPARVFPVTVNAASLRVATTGSTAPQVLPASASPATMALTASFNGTSIGTTTYAESQLPGDHSLEETINVGSPDSGTHKAISFVQFPGMGLDGSKITVSSASLDLAVVYASTCTAERFDVAEVTQPWTPSGVTAYPGPSYGASIGNLTPPVPHACVNTSLSMTAQPDMVYVPLSQSAIQALANGTTADYGLAIYAATTDSLHWKQFGSDSYPVGPPVLSVTYTAGNLLPGIISQFPVDQSVENTLTPTLQADGNIDCTLPSSPTIKFDFQVFNTGSTKIADSGAVADSVSGVCGGAVAWTVPSGDLKWGTQYYWTGPGLRRDELLAWPGVVLDEHPGAPAGGDVTAVAKRQRARVGPVHRELHHVGDGRERRHRRPFPVGGAGLQLAGPAGDGGIRRGMVECLRREGRG